MDAPEHIVLCQPLAANGCPCPGQQAQGPPPSQHMSMVGVDTCLRHMSMVGVDTCSRHACVCLCAQVRRSEKNLLERLFNVIHHLSPQQVRVWQGAGQ